MYILSCICLSFVGLVCLLTPFSGRYADNLLQRIGMGVLCLGCEARVESIWASQTVANDWFLVHGGMALVAAGVVRKVLMEERRRLRDTPSFEPTSGGQDHSHA
jgi:hypothetical protein